MPRHQPTTTEQPVAAASSDNACSPREWGLDVAAIVAFNAAAILGFGVEPVIAAQLSTQLGLSAHEVGILLGTEFAGSMLATLSAGAWFRYMSPRSIALGTAALFIVTNLLSAAFPQYHALLVCRALAGFAGGALIVLTLTLAARAARPARIYGLWVIGQTLTAAPALLFFSQLSARVALGTIYSVMAAAMLAALPLAWAFEPTAPQPAGAARAPQARVGVGALREAGFILAALLLFYVAASGAWAFAAERGYQLNLTAGAVGEVLSGAYLISLAGAVLAAWIGTPVRYAGLVAAGHVGLIVAIGLFAVEAGLVAFAAFAITLQLTWAFTAPLLLAMAGEIEPAGSMIAPATLILGAGLTAGPLLAGPLLETKHGARTMALALVAVLAVSLALLAARGRARLHHHAPIQGIPASRD